MKWVVEDKTTFCRIPHGVVEIYEPDWGGFGWVLRATEFHVSSASRKDIVTVDEAIADCERALASLGLLGKEE